MKKRIITLVLACIFGTILLSCGGGSDPNNRPDKPDPDSGRVYSTDLTKGKDLFKAHCEVCHGADGMGTPGSFPPLAGSDFLKDKDKAIHSMLNGLSGEIIVNGQKFNQVMPANVLSDQEAAEVMNYVFNSWGNALGMVSPEDVKKARAIK